MQDILNCAALIFKLVDEDWKKKIKDYLEDPVDKNPERIEKVLEIAAYHQLDQYMAAILSHSVKDI